MYYLYILECSDGTLYTGITKDLARRVKEHNGSKLGAKYTRGRRPVECVFSQRYKDRPQATKAEILVKRMDRKSKLALIRNKKREKW